MDIGKLSYHARRIHKLSLWFVVVLGLIQMYTGLVMKYPEFFAFADQNDSRLLHFNTASYFTIAFGIQMMTGIIIHLTPWMIKTFQKPSAPPTKLPN